MLVGRTKREAVLALAVALVGTSAFGATATWNAGDTSESWETSGAWTGGAGTGGAPGTADTASLTDVTSGTRTVTVDSPETINILKMTQTTAGAVNELTLNNSLTLSGTGTYSPFSLSPIDNSANVGSTVLNLNGQTLTASGSNSTNPTLNGTVMMSSGSKLAIQYAGSQGSAIFTNNGNLTQTGTTVEFDWKASSNNTSSGGRNFTNIGSWTLQNNSVVVFDSSTGRATSGFGIGTNNANSGTMSVGSGSSVGFQSLFNTGTLNIGSNTANVSDAAVTLGQLIQAAGHNSPSDLVNGLTPANGSAPGTININGNATFGYGPNSYGALFTTLANGSNVVGNVTSSGSTINVGDGATPLTFTVSNYAVNVYNAPGNNINIKANGTLFLQSSVSAASGANTTSTMLFNAGTVRQTGTVKLAPNRFGYTSSAVSNKGTYILHGATAQVERSQDLTNTAAGATYFVNHVGGVLTGDSTGNTLTYVNNTGTSNATFNTMVLTNMGTMAPGNGDNGAGTGSIGSLTLANTNLTLGGTALTGFTITSGGSAYTSAPSVTIGTNGSGHGAMAYATVSGGQVTALTLVNPGFNYTSAPSVAFSGGGGSGAAATAVYTALGGTLSFDIGGSSASGLYDTISLTGSGAALNLAAGTTGNVLNINTVNAYTPAGGETYTLVNYPSHSGTFDTLKLNGVLSSDYTVTYGSSGLSVTFVPEPGMMCLILGVAALPLLDRRRRGRQA